MAEQRRFFSPFLRLLIGKRAAWFVCLAAAWCMGVSPAYCQIACPYPFFLLSVLSSRGLLQDSGLLNARILRLPRPVVKDYACPFPFPETLGVAADEIDTY